MATTQVTPFQLTDQFTMDNFNERINETNTALGDINTALSERPNPNLLDNWYFGNPVNQRGKTEYTESGYSIDRWILNQWNTTSKACSVATNGLRVRGEASGPCSTSIKQFVEGIKAGCQVTASVLVTDFTVGSAVLLFIRTNSGVTLARVRFSKPGLYSVTTTLPDDFDGNLMIEIGQGGSDGGNGNTDFTVLATKLELGSQQTLAHQDANGNWVLNEIPDYGEQLARCQMRQIVLDVTPGFAVGRCFKASDTSGHLMIPVPCSFGNGNVAVVTTGDFRNVGYNVYADIPSSALSTTGRVVGGMCVIDINANVVGDGMLDSGSSGRIILDRNL